MRNKVFEKRDIVLRQDSNSRFQFGSRMLYQLS